MRNWFKNLFLVPSAISIKHCSFLDNWIGRAVDFSDCYCCSKFIHIDGCYLSGNFMPPNCLSNFSIINRKTKTNRKLKNKRTKPRTRKELKSIEICHGKSTEFYERHKKLDIRQWKYTFPELQTAAQRGLGKNIPFRFNKKARTILCRSFYVKIFNWIAFDCEKYLLNWIRK